MSLKTKHKPQVGVLTLFAYAGNLVWGIEDIMSEWQQVALAILKEPYC